MPVLTTLPRLRVAPFTGAWIEIMVAVKGRYLIRSLPSRERGLKFMLAPLNFLNLSVAPFTGAWIEMLTTLKRYMKAKVAPFTGAWIEITSTRPAWAPR